MRCRTKTARAAPLFWGATLACFFGFGETQPAAVPGRVKRLSLSVSSEVEWYSIPFQKDAACSGKKPVYGRWGR